MTKFFVVALMVFISINVFSAELYGYIKSFELDETTYTRLVLLDTSKPIRDENGNLITGVIQLRAGTSYTGDLFNTLVAACANNWGIKLILPTITENANITNLKTPYPMGAIPLNGLVAEYLFNGNAQDTSGRGHNGALYGNIKLTTGKFNTPNSAYEFDGIDDYIEIADAVDLKPENGSWSVALWFKAENIAQKSIFLSKREDVSPFEQYSIGITKDSHNGGVAQTLGFCYRDGNADRSGVTTANFADGNWHHTVFVFDNQTASVKIYADNKLTAITLQYNTGTWPTINNPDRLCIGCNGSQNLANRGYFKGIIENIRIYNLALTADDVNALFNETGDSF